MQFHSSSPYGNTTIFIGGSGHPTNDGAHQHESPDLGTFFQTVIAQIAGGGGGGGPQFPL